MADALHSRGRGLAPLSGPTQRHRRSRPPARISWPARFYHRLLAEAGVRVNGQRPWDMQVHDERLWWRILRHGTLGLGEAYVDGWWDAPRLDEFIARVVRARLDRRLPNLPKRIGGVIAALSNLQDLTRARQVGEQHYDLDHEMYRAMLGERMIYTCAYWPAATDLDAAQEHKLDLVCRKLGLAPGMRVLDIGCGWGGFARFAAERYGVAVTGVTISDRKS
ncbi:MAG: class I SAM-dependent methyltransferase, partial [Gammaproteobacteria bacterium]